MHKQQLLIIIYSILTSTVIENQITLFLPRTRMKFFFLLPNLVLLVVGRNNFFKFGYANIEIVSMERTRGQKVEKKLTKKIALLQRSQEMKKQGSTKSKKM
ncbi:hypothetical protein KCV07_g260, partial [Aureobasidium melanogenum]